MFFLLVTAADVTKINSRQIRNAFQTAIALAEYDSLENDDWDEDDLRHMSIIELNERHFATVAAASRDFDRYLRSTLGGQTDADMARLEQTRVDDFHHLVESREREQKSRDKERRRGQVQLDSEDSGPPDSEESEAGDGGSGSSGGSTDTPPPVKPVKSKTEKNAKKKPRNWI